MSQAKLEDSNVANIGSIEDIELRVKAARTEEEWIGAGEKDGIQIWRIENFNVKAWPKERYGQFYDGDSYIILHTYTKDSKRKYDVHFWLGRDTSIDEAGVAAYKTVELDDLLGGVPVQHREVHGFESPLFSSYFGNTLQIIHGGIASGFRTFTEEEFQIRLFHIYGDKHVKVIEKKPVAESLNTGDAFILDANEKIYCWYPKGCSGYERFRAGQLAQKLSNQRRGKQEIIHLDEEGNEEFWKLLGGKKPITKPPKPADVLAEEAKKASKRMVRVFCDDGKRIQQETIAEKDLQKEKLCTNDVFVVDGGDHIWVWIGKKACAIEVKNAMFVASKYAEQYKRPFYIPVTRIIEGDEPEDFWKVFA